LTRLTLLKKARRRFVWVEMQPWALVGLAGPRIG
jgi:hypothetical protein